MINHLLSRIKHYLSVYQGFVITCFIESLNFRLHFVLLILMDLLFYVSSLASIHIIYNHVEAIGPWNREQLMFFVAFMLGINQLTMTFVSESYWRFPLLIRTGELDFALLKPISSIFLVFFRYIRPGSMINMIFTWGVIIYFGIQLQLTVFAWCALPFLLILGFLLQNAVEMVICCSMFWMLEGTGINFVRMEMQQLARWPDFIYNKIVSRVLMTVLPILLIGSAPVRFLYNYNDWFPFLCMGFAILVFWSFLRFIWQIGLTTYESAFFSATVFIEPASEPASGSVRQKQPLR